MTRHDAVKRRFEDIYARNEWKYGSGAGSLPRHTRGYAQFLQRFFQQHQIRSVLDLGCGDWQFSRLIDWSGIRYRGFDVVPSVIRDNRLRFQSPNIEFELFHGDFDALPKADLLIAKDVLQHWSIPYIQEFIGHLNRWPKALITNCVKPNDDRLNAEIENGEFRPLDLRQAPFHADAVEVFTFSQRRPFPICWLRPPRWTKSVLLMESDGQKD